MKRALRPVVPLALLLLAFAYAVPAEAQEPAGHAAMVVWVTPLPGHALMFEEGWRRHVSNMEGAGGSDTWVTFEVAAGNRTGQYVIGSFNRAWAEFDQPPPGDPAEMMASVQDNLMPHVQEVRVQMLERDVELGKWSATDPIAPMYEVVRFRLKAGQQRAFENFMTKIGSAFDAAGGGAAYSFFRTVIGGEGFEVAVSVPHQGFGDWAGQESDWLEQLLYQTYGHADTETILASLAGAVDSSDSNLLMFRADLSMNLPEN